MNIKVLGTLSLNRTSTGVTNSAGTAASLTKVIEYQVPAAGYSVMLDSDTVLMIKDNGTTETADTSAVQVVAVKADRLATQVIEDSQYGLVKRNQDTKIQHHPILTPGLAGAVIIQPFGLLQVWINSDQTYSSSANSFTLIAKKVQIS